jgi:hypothetical protein
MAARVNRVGAGQGKASWKPTFCDGGRHIACKATSPDLILDFFPFYLTAPRARRKPGKREVR